MVSYFKTQWWRLLIALFCLVMAFVYMFKPEPDTSTIEGLNTLITYMFTAGMYFCGFIIWSFGSFVDYNQKCIEYFEKKAEKYDALCDLVEALREANEVDRDHDEMQDQKIKRLEDGLYDLRRKLYSDVD